MTMLALYVYLGEDPYDETLIKAYWTNHPDGDSPPLTRQCDTSEALFEAYEMFRAALLPFIHGTAGGSSTETPGSNGSAVKNESSTSVEAG